MTEQTQFSFDPTEFAAKRALVTGGTKGIGEAIVRRLSAAGAMVATTGRSPAELVAFLASNRAASIHGSEYVIGGGTVPTV